MDPRQRPEKATRVDPGDGRGLGVYVHVPYCASLCGYCDFYRMASPDGVPLEYDVQVLQEARLHVLETGTRADTVYFGGGTPSLLPVGRLGHLLAGLREWFAVAEEAETTLEANPETVTEASLEGWRRAGVNRLSLGVQSFQPAVLSLLQRRATAGQALEAVNAAGRAGFARLSVDLMAGVPGQSMRNLEDDLRRTSDLPVDHLSVYALDLHPGTPLALRAARGEVLLPDDDQCARMWERVHAVLTGAGWDHYEISNFARRGGVCRHNLKYWRGGDYVGLGPSSWSRIRGRLLGNPRDGKAWAEALRAGLPPWETEEILTPERLLEDRIIFGLRLAEGVPLAEVRSLFAGAEASLARLLERLAGLGLAETIGERLRLTPSGFLVSNAVLAELLSIPRTQAERGTREGASRPQSGKPDAGSGVGGYGPNRAPKRSCP
ncbi:MAG: radical SAM family heme chaperone HemW [Acidobacteriota bacterium]